MPEGRIEAPVRAKNGEYYWRLVAHNGETLAVSETYTRPEDAIRGASQGREAAIGAEIVEARDEEVPSAHERERFTPNPTEEPDEH